ncbi:MULTISPECIES: hypothetical protein [Psychrobacter]|jgi:hypothetical protein|uniref:Uncharacterized protein n=1 Tax=Psychrobacter namhaensis TaxID=292734 RepID=A0ABW8L598_9GAMM|nr:MULTISPECIES: hypothetical protein [Psychrobacter]MCD1278391.1 hypothetical protein [Psychrobacter sp. CCUG 69069]|tara:strand:- start:642 stop:1091 length:450 start_codon:yes stop_codon:yes gene_type:complete
MPSPNNKTDLPNKPRRPARSIREIRQRQLGNRYQSPLDRMLYALLNGVMYGFGGLLIDLAIVVIRSIVGIGNGEIFWLFTPFMLLLGALMGFIVGKSAGAESINALNIDETANNNNYLNNYSVRHDIFRGLIIGIIIFAIIWLVMMLMT